MDNKDTKRTNADQTLAMTSSSSSSSSSSETSPQRARKRKTSPPAQTPKRGRLCDSESPKPREEDLRVKVLKRKIKDRGESVSPNEKSKKRRFDISQEDLDSASTSGCTASSSDVERSSSEEVRQRDKKRKAEAGDEGSKKKRKTVRDDEDLQQDPKPENLSLDELRALFEAKYEEEDQLGEGGFGSVYAGYRKSDHLPVAIKHVPREKDFYKHTDANGNQLPIEVAVMLKLSSGPVGTSAPVTLLDWYKLEQELILVMERPVPCTDLSNHISDSGGALEEEEAKIIVKQLVDAAKELEEKQIFHRDIKVENILIETGSDTPRVRLIDFGLSCFVKKHSCYRVFCGTSAHIPPEWYKRSTYRAGPATVWQVGAVLYNCLHKQSDFETKDYLGRRLRIGRKLSEDCRDFLLTCLTRNPKQRPTLEQLQRHPWFG